MPIIGEWLDPIWSGHKNEIRGIRAVHDLPPVLPKNERYTPRDPSRAMKQALIARDGFHCRLCGIPLIRAEVRKELNRLYPKEARWTGLRPVDQHRGLQVMWLQYDHVIVHSRGGPTTMENLVVTCPACNFGRDRYMLSEVGLRDPRFHRRLPTWPNWKEWDGLERILPSQSRWFEPASTRQAAGTSPQLNFDDLRELLFASPILGSDGSHSARLWRVAENLEAGFQSGSGNERLLHLMSRVGILTEGMAKDLRSGHIAPEQAADLLDHLGMLGKVSFES